MMHRIRVYADTSVFGGTQDEEFAKPSRAFFDRVRNGEFQVLVSQVTIDEISLAPSAVQDVYNALEGEQLENVPVSPDVRALAQCYVSRGALGKASWEDALHVAAATVARADLILSWNFRHIVNIDRIRRFNSVNLVEGFAAIDIRSPLEVQYGQENENV